MKPSGELFLERKQSRGLGVHVREATRKARGRGARPPPGHALHPCGALVAPLTDFFRLYISIYSKTIVEQNRSGVPPPQASVAMRNQSRPSLAPCRRGPSSSEAMEEDIGGAIIAMKAKDQRENLSPSRGRPWRRKHKGENLSFSISMALECHREGNHRRGDRLHQHHHHHHHPHLFYAVHSLAPCCNPYLNMVLYATYYDPMMCCHPMMVLVDILYLWVD